MPRALDAAHSGPAMAPAGPARPSKTPFFGFPLILETLSHSAPTAPAIFSPFVFKQLLILAAAEPDTPP